MIQITYNNNTIKSIGRTTDMEIVPDDRQEIVKTIGGVVVEDYGVVANGEITTLSCVFSATDYSTLLNYWSNRTRVTVTLDDDTVISNARIVIRRTQFANEVLNKYKKVYMEVWKI